MFAIRAEHGELKYGVYDLIYDTMDDFNKKTPHSGVQAGSTAFIIDTSKKYMLNNDIIHKESEAKREKVWFVSDL